MNRSKAKTTDVDFEKNVERAIAEVVGKQIDLGLDVITDGEMPRENYYLHFCRHLEGIDTKNVEEKTMRSGTYYININSSGKKQIQIYDW